MSVRMRAGVALVVIVHNACPLFPAKALGWEGGRALLQYMRAGEDLAQCQAGVALLDLSTEGLGLPRVGSVVDVYSDAMVAASRLERGNGVV